jgi:hypothetical protein
LALSKGETFPGSSFAVQKGVFLIVSIFWEMKAGLTGLAKMESTGQHSFTETFLSFTETILLI